jgi:hypothetical protein
MYVGALQLANVFPLHSSYVTVNDVRNCVPVGGVMATPDTMALHTASPPTGKRDGAQLPRLDEVPETSVPVVITLKALAGKYIAWPRLFWKTSVNDSGFAVTRVSMHGNRGVMLHCDGT